MDATETILTLVTNSAIAVALYFVIFTYRYPLAQVYGINAGLSFLSTFLNTIIRRARSRRERGPATEFFSMPIFILSLLAGIIIFALPFFRFSILHSFGLAGSAAIAAFVGWAVGDII